MDIDKSKLQKQFSKDWQKHYNLEVFANRGFARKLCPSCKRFFWTADRKRRKCGDSTCEPYGFIGKKVKGATDYSGTWSKFSDFFAKNGRTPINRYPTIARWRDDTLFTQASIYAFQPYVVTGDVRPPANPLVMAQPCFRFNDLENIGVTQRHYSGFVMLGQHNFISSKSRNSSGWKEDDMRLVIDAMNNFGIGDKDLTFSESVWAGGGNAGPAFEGFYKGMEFVTTVFMQYQATPSGLKELPIKTIDFGWGLERLAWLLNGTPTSYEIAFDPVDKKLAKELKLNFNTSLMKKYILNSANMDLTEVDTNKAWKTVAKRIGASEDKLKREIEQMQAFYSILDHSRTLLFALADGGLPSNSGGGYNLRFILRRALRLAEKYGWKINLGALVREHAQALSGNYRPRQAADVSGRELIESGQIPMYPELVTALPSVESILEFETGKHLESQIKTASVMGNIFQKKKKITTDDLVTLYDSKGVLPEDIKAQAEKDKIKFVIPSNFYSVLADRHTAQKPTKLKENINVKDLPETKALYYADENLSEFTAKVIAVIDNKYVVLDRTAFYPVGGGQLTDTGTLNGKEIVGAEKVGGVILHEIVSGNFREGQMVNGQIDWNRRKALTRNHDATHIINGVVHSYLGNHIWQAGSEVGPDKARLDITHFAPLTQKDLQNIERLANEVVFSDLPITKITYPKDQAEKKFGFRIYQGGFIPGADIRILEIPGIDVEACGGTHGSKTSETGFIKILGSKKIQDGVVRIEFTAGPKAIEELHKRENLLLESAEAFSVPIEQLPKTSKRFFEDWKKLKKEVEKLSQMSKLQQQQPQVQSNQKKK